MKTKVRPSIVGAFVLGAFGLGLIALLSFGSISFLHKRERFVIFFDESIQGLTLGAPVKMSGVTLGRVIDTHVAYNPAKPTETTVEVIGEFESNVIIDNEGKTIDVSNASEVQGLVAHGLRGQITVTGLATGLAVVELGFFDPADYPATIKTHSARHPDYPVIPAVRSNFAELQTSAMEIMANMKQIDFNKLGKNLNTLLVEGQLLVADARRKLKTVDLKALVDQWRRTGTDVAAVVDDPALKGSIAELDSTLKEVRTAVARISGQVDTNGSRLGSTLEDAQKTLQQFNAAAATLQRFIAAQSGLGDSATQAFNQLGAAADSVQRLADFLERNPNALLSGRKPPSR